MQYLLYFFSLTFSLRRGAGVPGMKCTSQLFLTFSKPQPLVKCLMKSRYQFESSITFAQDNVNFMIIIGIVQLHSLLC